ncbi:hypothetical protein EZ456_18720 [Pedobacter psychrodurus]|uniref:Uncharacterized protein n=1 Tax=Pedobacter psychrodurus TaxID=2530456 RepID=A0A4R0PMB2_9SPHI|nr:hypothetical protein [Pedobacter psychrodurus]TCD21800.1 hypothetical protein EZ456_18720 [Pedobacter psychrodurus]
MSNTMGTMNVTIQLGRDQREIKKKTTLTYGKNQPLEQTEKLEKQEKQQKEKVVEKKETEIELM